MRVISGGLRVSLLLLFPLLLSTCVPAHNDDPLANSTSDGDTPSVLVLPTPDQVPDIRPGKYLQYYSEAAREGVPNPWQRALAGERVRWQRATADYPNPGMTPLRYWFRLHVSSEAAQDRFIYFPHSFDVLDVWVQHNGIVRPGCSIGRNHGALKTRRPVCNVRIPVGESAYYFRVKNHATLWLPLHFLSEASYHRRLETENLLYGAYFGILFIMAVYNFVIYLRTREISYLPYVGFTLSNIAYFLVQSGFAAYYFFPESPGWHQIIGPTTAVMFGLTACVFASSFLRLRTRSARIYYFMVGLQMLLIVLWVLVLLIPGAGNLPNQLLAGAALGICLILPAIAIRSYHAGYAPARIYVVAVLAFFMGGALFIARILGWLPANWLTLHALPAGSLAQVTLFSLALAERIDELRTTVAHNLNDLESAHRELARSEGRYRQLVEGSSDLIFVLNNAGRLLQVNAAAFQILGTRAADIVGRPLASLLYVEPEAERSGGFQRALLTTQLNEVHKQGAVRFPLRLANRLGQPIDVEVALERIVDSGANEDASDSSAPSMSSMILGKACPPDENALSDALVSERGVFTIGNYLSEADALYHRATLFLTRYFKPEDAEMIIFALREMIMNAIEHGNLGIRFNEKTRAQETGRYLELLLERQRRPDLRNRQVRLEYSLNARRVMYRITDAGEGFDHQAILRESSVLLGDMEISHGRGIALARQFFDIVRYNERGNSVVLIRAVPEESEKVRALTESVSPWSQQT